MAHVALSPRARHAIEGALTTIAISAAVFTVGALALLHYRPESRTSTEAGRAAAVDSVSKEIHRNREILDSIVEGKRREIR
jgi:hypothetical protein